MILGKMSIYHFYHCLWNKELKWLMIAKCITTNGTKDLLFTAQELKIANYYIAYLRPEYINDLTASQSFKRNYIVNIKRHSIFKFNIY